jgi:catechol 2,3-dioxygenase-like lactoylglutathione lyase family enzyme
MLGLPLHHVGIACSDIETTFDFIKRAYTIETDSGTVFDPLQRAYVRILNESRPGALELVSGQVVETLLKHRSTYYHLCYLTPHIASSIEQAKKAGCMLVSKPAPAVLFGGRLVAFVHSPLGLIEFLEDH